MVTNCMYLRKKFDSATKSLGSSTLDYASIGTFIRFALVGGAAYLIHFLFVWLISYWLSSSFWIGVFTTCSFCSVCIASYFAHKIFTFHSSKNDKNSIISYSLIVTVGAVTSGLISFYLGQFDDWVLLLIGQAMFIGVWAVISIKLMRKFVYTSRKDNLNKIYNTGIKNESIKEL